MYIVSTLIFSDPSLGYDKSRIKLPVDINQTFPKNGSGLCNQLFRVCNSLAFLHPQINEIYFDLFCKDIMSGKMVKLSEILSFPEMKAQFGYKIFDITDLEDNDFQIYNDNYFFRSYHTNSLFFEKILKSLIWNSKFEDISKKIISKMKLQDRIVNLVHLRIDQDFKTHILGLRTDPNTDYNTEYWRNREQAYNDLVSNYEKAIYQNCDNSIPLVILMDEVTHPFVEKLKKDYEVLFFDRDTVLEVANDIEGRELFALIDLLIGKNLTVNNFIGLETKSPLSDGNQHSSTFSIVLKYLSNSKKTIMV